MKKEFISTDQQVITITDISHAGTRWFQPDSKFTIDFNSDGIYVIDTTGQRVWVSSLADFLVVEMSITGNQPYSRFRCWVRDNYEWREATPEEGQVLASVAVVRPRYITTSDVLRIIKDPIKERRRVEDRIRKLGLQGIVRALDGLNGIR
jgi:hypothetical protein